MISPQDILYKDFEAVNRISIVPMMLDVICRTTGMGFAAVARVTEDRWLACSVRDEVSFGLTAGAELEIKTTICNEIRDNRQPVIIDHVDLDVDFKNHHTPKMYGLQSYISYPIILKNGEFFGTLCAIDSKPAKVKDPKVMGIFIMFADLLAFHLESIELLDRSHVALLDANFENSQYKKVTSHNLQEPVRKIRLYSNLLIEQPDKVDKMGTKEIAIKINSFAEELSNMISAVSKFSAPANIEQIFEIINLNDVLSGVCLVLSAKLQDKRMEVLANPLPDILGIPEQIQEFFAHLMTYMLTSISSDQVSLVRVYVKDIDGDAIGGPLHGKNLKFCTICIEHQHSAIDLYYTKNIFDIFVHSNSNAKIDQYNAGLANCKKIIQNHGGTISAELTEDNSVCFSVVLPVYRKY